MSFENINERLFSNWHMKYAIFHKDILSFFVNITLMSLIRIYLILELYLIL